MNAFSKLFSLNYIRHWAKLSFRELTLENKRKSQVYKNCRDIGLSSECSKEWAELGPWNV